MSQRHPLGRLFALLLLWSLVGCAEKPTAARAGTRAETRQPAGYWAYVGTYTGTKSKGIYFSKFDPASGSLTRPALAAETPSPSFLALSPDNRFLYAVNEVNEFAGKKMGAVSAFAVDATTGGLTAIGQDSSGGEGPCHLVVDPAGKVLIVANYAGGSTYAIALRPDGTFGTQRSLIQHEGSSVNPQRQEAPHAHCVALEPGRREPRRALVADLGLDRIVIYQVPPEPGKLTPNDPLTASVKPGSGPRHLAFSPDGQFLYCINELASTVTIFAYNVDRGEPKELQTISTLPENFKGDNSTAEIRVHPSGKFVYGSNRGYDSIAIFRADPKTGKLTAAGHQSTQGKTPRSFSIDPSGRYLLAANQNSDTIVVFRIDQQTGTLTPTGTAVNVPAPVCVEFVPIQ